MISFDRSIEKSVSVSTLRENNCVVRRIFLRTIIEARTRKLLTIKIYPEKEFFKRNEHLSSSFSHFFLFRNIFKIEAYNRDGKRKPLTNTFFHFRSNKNKSKSTKMKLYIYILQCSIINHNE